MYSVDKKANVSILYLHISQETTVFSCGLNGPIKAFYLYLFPAEPQGHDSAD